MSGPQAVAEVLAASPCFGRCSPEVLSRLAAMAEEVVLGPDRVLFGEREDGQHVFVVSEGAAEARRRTPFGDLRVAGFGVGDVVGEVSFLDGLPRSSTLVSTAPTRFLRLDGRSMRLGFESDAVFAAATLRAFWLALAAKVRAANLVMLEIMSPGTTVPMAPGGAAGESVDVTDATKRHFLRELGLDDAELGLLSSRARAERFAPGALIFSEGDEGDALHVVLEGKVRISRRPPGMGEEALAVLGRGEAFGEMALVDDRPRSADARAHTEGCAVLVIDREHLDRAFAESPQSARQFLTLMCKILCRRLRAMTDLLVAWRVMAGFG